VTVDVVVPQIGEAIASLQLVAWRKNIGDRVGRGEPLFDVDSDKAIVEVEAFVDGVLVEVLAPAGSNVLPQQVVGRIQTVEEQTASIEPRISPVARRIATDLQIELDAVRNHVKGSGPGGRIVAEDVRRYAEQHKAQPPEASPADGRGSRVNASPKAKRLAQELDVDLGSMVGSGVGGMIIARDVETAAAQPPGTPETPEPVPLTKIRETMAARTQASKQHVPHFYLMVDVNMAQVDRLRRYCTEKLGWERAPTYTDIIIRGCALAIVDMPVVNRSCGHGGLIQRQTIGIGVAVNTESGLVVPVIPNADRLALAEVSAALKGATERARLGRLRPDDLGEKSMVVSNLGMYGIDTFVAIIDMPDPMILAVGRTADRVVPLHGQIAIQPVCTLTLSVDHRVLDGVQGAQFLGKVKDYLEEPFELLGTR